MARDISARYILEGDLVAQTPLHVGGLGDDVDTDLPLARDGAGRLYIPGTSLAGPLRHWCNQAYGEEFVEQTWGFQQDDSGHASHILVDDAVIQNPGEIGVEIRDGVGIDRKWGAAAEHIKYDRAILARGTKLPLCLIAEVRGDQEPKKPRTEASSNSAEAPIRQTSVRDKTLAMLAALRLALVAGDIPLGAAKTRGLGCVKLDQSATIVQQELNTRKGIFAFLKGTHEPAKKPGTDEPVPSTLTEALQRHPPRPQQRITFEVGWRPRGPLMVKAGFDGVTVDMIPLVSATERGLALALPGSSAKGALRSLGERIVRTLLDIELSSEEDPKKRFLLDLELPLIDEVFGLRGVGGSELKPARAGKTLDEGPLPGLGALSVADCFGTQTLTSTQWLAIQSAGTDAALRKALNSSQSSREWHEAYHVAIDRWTGGAAESFLYTVLEPHGATWEPLRLTLDLSRLTNEHHLPAVALILILLRDLCSGRLPLGFATHRGMGAIDVQEIKIESPGAEAPLTAINGLKITDGRLTSIPDECRQKLNQSWATWINQAKAREEGAA